MSERRQDLLDYYRDELDYLRQAAAEFARENPKVAERLELGGDPAVECEDPHVERLLEGVAFLAARVRLKLDAEYPRFTQALLETIYPYYLSPWPAMAIVQFKPALDQESPAGHWIPPGHELRESLAPDEERVTPCTLRTAHGVRVFPLLPPEAEYVSARLGDLHLPERLGAKAAIRVRLRARQASVFRTLQAEELTFFLHGSLQTGLPALLYEELFAHTTAIAIQDPSGYTDPWAVLPATALRQRGFEDDEALLPADARCFSGHRLLQEYFAFPQRFFFAQLTGLRNALPPQAGAEVDLVFVLDRENPALERRFRPECFQLFCTPAINLFEHLCDNVDIRDRWHEFPVVPDKNQLLDHEVYRLKRVVAVGEDPKEEHEFHPFYAIKDSPRRPTAFYTLRRAERRLTEVERRTRQHPDYLGSDCHIALVDEASAPFRTRFHGDGASAIRRLRITAECTNRHLATGMGRQFDVEGIPVQAIEILGQPTLPRSSPAEGEFAWRLIAHLGLSHQALVAGPGPGVAALRRMLELHTPPGEVRQPEIESLRSLASRVIMRRVRTQGPVPFAFARGLEITAEFDEKAAGAPGVFLFGAVLERFLSRYVSVNSFTETTIRTRQGDLKKWPARSGTRLIC